MTYGSRYVSGSYSCEIYQIKENRINSISFLTKPDVDLADFDIESIMGRIVTQRPGKSKMMRDFVLAQRKFTIMYKNARM